MSLDEQETEIAMDYGHNKNKSFPDTRLLKINYKKNPVSWKKVLVYIVLLANVFKGCLIHLRNREVYILTLTSAELLVSLQEASLRKASDLVDINHLYNIYGDCHTYAIYWTVKGNAKVLPECLETSQLFRNIVNESKRIQSSSSAILPVEFDRLFSDPSVSKPVLKNKDNGITYNVNAVIGVSYKNDLNGKRRREKRDFRHENNLTQDSFSLTRSHSNSKVNVPLEETIYPYTGNEYHNVEYPQQISGEQEGQGQSSIAFSNGASFPTLPSDQYGFRSSLNRTPLPTTEASRLAGGHPRYPEYVNKHERIRSYARWTHRKPDPNQLSEAGFFFTDQSDLVRCFQCGIGLKDFSEDDNPLNEHVRHSSRCPFLLEYLGQTQLSSVLYQLQAQDPELNRQRQFEEIRRTSPESNYTARHPEYRNIEVRLKTFDKWPSNRMQTPRQLAEAGLYYTGYEDHVRCFACDGGLRRWDPEDEPWTEHCRWFPACPFARAEKGDDFIALVQASSNYGNEENGEDLSSTMQQMTLRDPVYNAALNEHKDTCLEMGYQLADFNEAVQEIRDRGTVLPHIEEILDTIEVIKDKKRQALKERKKQNETPIEENQRLKRLVICMLCGTNNVNALFLPCTHHRLCMTCAEPLTSCPVCERNIRQKIRTYLV
ncbi:baculoviral IAP repeat-containing protein 7-like [Ruditapes philippinarum]|uniref:baculoviral IAP repeat-containing protein 7-like n=1 Tax=Ruditapes philippinarum TaxID=129788 RepID=UPI00295BCD9B|nr:baculoviral IAP repeat-containing protein 7-like [Ruditapes philippinarum]XP_060592565.1 baculoviral IAP repeat-containing protein 7-like [Ruditapes philippinarum]